MPSKKPQSRFVCSLPAIGSEPVGHRRACSRCGAEHVVTTAAHSFSGRRWQSAV